LTVDLGGCLAKVQLAHAKLQAFQTDHLMVCKTDPVRLRTEPERAPYRYLFTAEHVPRLPHRLGVRLGNVVHGLRSALDHLAWQVALFDGRGTRPGPATRFPIEESPEAFHSDWTPIADLAPEHRALVEADQPFRRTDPQGDDPLAALERLSLRERTEVPMPLVSSNLMVTPQLVLRDPDLEVTDLEWMSRPGRLLVGATLCRFTVSRPMADGAALGVRGIVVPGTTLDGTTDAVGQVTAIGARVVQVLEEWESRLTPGRTSDWPVFDATRSVFPAGAIPFMAS